MTEHYPINTFFTFFRRRVANIENLHNQPPQLDHWEPETHVLAFVAVDALANHWAATFEPDIARGQDRERLSRFLLKHGDANIFSRFSTSDFIRRAHVEGFDQKLIDQVKPFRKPLTPGAMRGWNMEPRSSDVTESEELLNAFPTHHPTNRSKNGNPSSLNAAQWVSRSRFGDVFYSEFRSSWVHTYTGGKGTSTGWKGDNHKEPRYMNWEGPPNERLVFPVPYLLKLLSMCIDCFEAECSQAGHGPIER